MLKIFVSVLCCLFIFSLSVFAFAENENSTQQLNYYFSGSADICKQKITDSLGKVIDPELDVNVVDLGLIRSIECDVIDRHVLVTMILTSPFCPYIKDIVRDIRSVTKQTCPSMNIDVRIDARTRWKPSFMTERGKSAFWGEEE